MGSQSRTRLSMHARYTWQIQTTKKLTFLLTSWPLHSAQFSSVTQCNPMHWLFATPWTVACQAPLSMAFSRQEYWSGLPLSRGSSQPRDQTWVYRIAGRFFTVWATREAHVTYTHILLDRGGCVVKTKVNRIRGILPKEKNDKGEVGGGNRWFEHITQFSTSEVTSAPY